MIPLLLLALTKFPDGYYRVFDQRWFLLSAVAIFAYTIPFNPDSRSFFSDFYANVYYGGWFHVFYVTASITMIIALIAMAFSNPSKKWIFTMILISIITRAVYTIINFYGGILYPEILGVDFLEGFDILFWLAFAGALLILNRRIYPSIIAEK
jgi:hypothetical protein